MFLRRISAAFREEIENVVFDEIYEHSFIPAFDKASVIIDLGAGNGNFPEEFAKRYRFAKFILIEANPSLAKDLNSHFKGKAAFQIINSAIGGESKEGVEFYLSRNKEAGSINKCISETFCLEEGCKKIIIPMVTLKDIISRFNLKRIDLLKIDTEGAECDIIDKLEDRDFSIIDQISVEFHDFIDTSLRPRIPKCIARLKKSNYAFIAKGTQYLQGSQYYNCLFYKKRLFYTSLFLSSFKLSYRLLKRLCLSRFASSSSGYAI